MTENGSRISVAQQGQETVIQFKDSSILGEGLIHELQAQVMKAVTESSVADVRLDMKRIQFMASSFIRLLVMVRKEVLARKGTLTLCQVDPKLYEVFKITQLHKVFTFEK